MQTRILLNKDYNKHNEIACSKKQEKVNRLGSSHTKQVQGKGLSVFQQMADQSQQVEQAGRWQQMADRYSAPTIHPGQVETTALNRDFKGDAKLKNGWSKQESKPIQRVKIVAKDIEGMNSDMDTSNYDQSTLLLDGLFDTGKRNSLLTIYQKISEANKSEKLKANSNLKDYIEQLLRKKVKDDPESTLSGYLDHINMYFSYKTPKKIDENVKAGLRIWIAGDPDYGISWKAIGLYLQGRLPKDNLKELGMVFFMKEESETNKKDTSNDKDKEDKGEELIKKAIKKLNGALDALPGHEGLSYRQAGVKNGSVYGSKINTGDYIMDKSFWSTSALKLDGSAGNWGSDGSKEKPKVYFIITGSTGKYINKHAQLEEGQHEVLFKSETVFKVGKIANYKGETFFVHVNEVSRDTLNKNDDIKDPYEGEKY